MKKSHFKNHVRSARHVQATCRQDRTSQMLLTKMETQDQRNIFLRKYLEKYTKQNIPDESTLRKNYLPRVHQKVLEEIRKEISDNVTWFAVDETIDACERYVALMVVRKLDGKDCAKIYHLLGKFLKTNAQAIARFVQEGLMLLYN
ncbi:uncharacterized protein LOC111633131 [Centruroides sculpturatus]|uniref:uncharacterized protein LOC111633131 n=1 Tax=Centruroides sculpturatus TaxID=218467 RepID=UPI000C6E5086|nr:uncharacterized protein LOC111633131 [Centruroides sculpturatus]